MVESTVCMLIICLVLFGLLQVFYLYAAQLIFDYSSWCVTRSAAVGFWGRDANDEEGYLLRRSMRVAAIGASGNLEAGDFSGDDNPLLQFGWERIRIPEYIQGLEPLNYEYWPRIADPNPIPENSCVSVTVGCAYPLVNDQGEPYFPMLSAFTSSKSVDIKGKASALYYAAAYLEGQ